MVLEHALCELGRRRARSLAVAAGYALAVAAMIVLVGVLELWGRDNALILGHTGTHFVAYSPVGEGGCACERIAGSETAYGSAGGEGFLAMGGPSRLMPNSFAGKVRGIAGVRDASAFLLYRFQGRDGAFTVGGFDPGDAVAVSGTSCAASDLVAGKFLLPGGKGEALVEEAYSRARGIRVGDSILIAADAFRVAGIVDTGIRPARADVYLPFGEAESAIASRAADIRLPGYSNLILIEAADSSSQEAAIAGVKALYPDLVVSSYACYRPAAKAKGLGSSSIAILVAAIAAVTALLGLLSQASLLAERKRDIGILKTIGFSNARIMGQILAESIILAAAGALVACCLALPAMPLVFSRMHSAGQGLPLRTWLGIAGTASGLALGGGLVAGVFPALWAGFMRPSALLRSH